MASYDFRCDRCKKIYEIKMSFKEHDELKDKLECQECHTKLIQEVSTPTFKLSGGGWAIDNYGQGAGTVETFINQPSNKNPVTTNEIKAGDDFLKRTEDIC